MQAFGYADCPAVGRLLGCAVTHLGAAIDARAFVWGTFGWHNDPRALATTSGKRRRTDAHVKQWALSDAISSGSASSVGAAVRALPGRVARSLGNQWRKELLSQARAGAMMAFANKSFNHSTCWDGWRGGQPSKELLGGILEDLDKHAVVILAPQD